MKRPVYVISGGATSFVGHASSALGAKRIASKYGHDTIGQASLTEKGRFVLVSKG